MGIIDEIFQTGDDALGDQFDIFFPNLEPVLSVISTLIDFDIPESFNIRTNSCNIPETTINTEDIKFDGYTIKKPNGSNSNPYTFSFDFRNDKYWNYYTFFKIWTSLVEKQKIPGVSTDGVAGSAISVLRNTITVKSNNHIWNFLNAYPISVSGIAFNHTDTAPLVTTVNFVYSGEQFI